MTQRHALLDQLSELRLTAMARAFEEQLLDKEIAELSFEERLGLLLDRESTERSSRRLTLRLRQAKLRYPNACFEDLDLRAKRGLNRTLMMKLRTCDWISDRLNLFVTGRPALARPSWAAPWPTRRAARITRRSTGGSRSCFASFT